MTVGLPGKTPDIFCAGAQHTVTVSKLDTHWEGISLDTKGKPLTSEHGGPARLLVPHLHFWKGAKSFRGLRLLDRDEPGVWESFGYDNHGDPWKEERYSGD